MPSPTTPLTPPRRKILDALATAGSSGLPRHVVFHRAKLRAVNGHRMVCAMLAAGWIAESGLDRMNRRLILQPSGRDVLAASRPAANENVGRGVYFRRRDGQGTQTWGEGYESDEQAIEARDACHSHVSDAVLVWALRSDAPGGTLGDLLQRPPSLNKHPQ